MRLPSKPFRSQTRSTYASEPDRRRRPAQAGRERLGYTASPGADRRGRADRRRKPVISCILYFHPRGIAPPSSSQNQLFRSHEVRPSFDFQRKATPRRWIEGSIRRGVQPDPLMRPIHIFPAGHILFGNIVAEDEHLYARSKILYRGSVATPWEAKTMRSCRVMQFHRRSQRRTTSRIRRETKRAGERDMHGSTMKEKQDAVKRTSLPAASAPSQEDPVHRSVEQSR